MQKIYKSILLCGATLFSVGVVSATELTATKASADSPETTKEDKWNLGQLTGSFETNTIFYTDVQSGSGDPFYGSNNFLKLNYTNGAFSAGIQMEYYPRVLRGYESRFEGIGVPMKFVSYQHKNFSVTIGDYYEQFGSGLLFRAWEDRQLGFNNSIGGGRITFNTDNNSVTAKVIYGFPRDYLHSTGAGYPFIGSLFNDYSTTQILGGDLSISLTKLLFPNSNHNITLEGSGLYRMMHDIPGNYQYAEGLGKNQFSYSARLAYQFKNFSIKGEYVGKGDDYYETKDFLQTTKGGNAQLVEMNYSQSGFTFSGVFRRLFNMQELAYYPSDNSSPLAGNTLNYVPALVQAQTYLLTTINPYIPYVNGEIGGQIDLFYNVKRGTALGGKYGMKLHFNASNYYSLGEALYNVNTDKLSYFDFNFSVDKKWNSNLKTKFQYSHQEMSPDHGETDKINVMDIFVADVTYKFSRTFSLRGELQYLFSKHIDGDWAAALLEANFAPKWSIFASDMYNVGRTKDHYYSIGVSYTQSSMRLAASYGHNREGQICSGGVCRMQPEYTGANIQLTLLF